MPQMLVYAIVGFAAELIDGSMGMAYGVSSNTFLRSVGVPSAVSSACVHFAEIFTTLASGLSHLRLKNVCKEIFLRLLIPGMIGGALGAYLLVSFENRILDIAIDCYLIAMGLIIVSKVFQKQKKPAGIGRGLNVLGFIGGLSDAMGGGGWGPVVTSTLLATDHEPRTTIGSVNTAEFFVTVAETTTFVALLDGVGEYAVVILGLLVGGILAAPIGAWLCQKIKPKPMLAFVGAMIIVLNVIKLIGHIHAIIE